MSESRCFQLSSRWFVRWCTGDAIQDQTHRVVGSIVCDLWLRGTSPFTHSLTNFNRPTWGENGSLCVFLSKKHQCFFFNGESKKNQRNKHAKVECYVEKHVFQVVFIFKLILHDTLISLISCLFLSTSLDCLKIGEFRIRIARSMMWLWGFTKPCWLRIKTKTHHTSARAPPIRTSKNSHP